jgi:hypothetical protein
MNKKKIRMHRFFWTQTNKKEIPKGFCVCHSCDNRMCINPSHLWLGTQADNMRDMTLKGRRRGTFQIGYNAKGEKNGQAKLTKAIVLKIINSSFCQKDIALKYKISQSHVSMIKRGIHWPHLQQEKLHA